MRKIKDYSLYLVASQKYGLGRNVLEIAREAISGGIDVLQMREKHASREELVRLGKELASLCAEYGVIFIINDDPFLAKEVNADGVHLGQEDIKKFPVERAREILGVDKIVGISTHSAKQFKEANEGNFDYVAFGPVFSTETKDYSIGTENVQEVMKIARKPVVFIGGINLGNIDIVLKDGAKNIAAIRGIVQADDIASRVKEFKKKIDACRKRRKLTVRINGKKEKINEESTLIELIERRGLNPDRVIIEHNMEIIPKEKWPKVFINGEDTIEIISFMGGGSPWKIY
ncbi:MAG: thiamine phosphate synthase [Candidatus Omnitrophota bacterium]